MSRASKEGHKTVFVQQIYVQPAKINSNIGMYVVWSIIIKAVNVRLVHHKLNFFHIVLNCRTQGEHHSEHQGVGCCWASWQWHIPLTLFHLQQHCTSESNLPAPA